MSSAALQSGDAELVARSRAGDRNAFSEIVSRYQALVCSLTYSATGNVTRSEDLAQETFVAAWKQLGTLREPERLRSWLCGIARNLINNHIRRNSREPAQIGEPLEIAENRTSPLAAPDDRVMQAEEEAIVWRALEQLPYSYREPLVLFYREAGSVQTIANDLELSQDAVKQRLSRGREMLREQVAAVVEGALKRTRPGKLFTLTVMAALPSVVVTSAKAAVLGAAGKTIAPSAPALLSVAGLGAVLGPLLGFAGGAFGTWASWQNARYQSQRDLIRKAGIFYLGSGVIFIIGTIALRLLRQEWIKTHAVLYAVGLVVGIFGYVALVLFYSGWFAFRMRKITAAEIAAGATLLPQTKWSERMVRRAARWEGRQWRSNLEFLGLPLIDVHFSSPGRSCGTSRLIGALGQSQGHIAKGWIAFGDRAHGILFACGNIAIGGVALGGVAAGLIAIGGVALGALSIGGFAIGLVTLAGFAAGGIAWGGASFGVAAIGGLAVGWVAAGGGAFAWRAAQGGLAYAHDFACGGKAIAAHANDALAKDHIANSRFFQIAEWQLKHVAPNLGTPSAIAAIVALSLLGPALLYTVGYRRVRAADKGLS